MSLIALIMEHAAGLNVNVVELHVVIMVMIELDA